MAIRNVTSISMKKFENLCNTDIEIIARDDDCRDKMYVLIFKIKFFKEKINENKSEL